MLNAQPKLTKRGKGQIWEEHPHLARLLERARQRAKLPVAIVYPCDSSSLEAAIAAWEEGLIEPVLVGPKTRILAAMQARQLDASSFPIVDCEDEPRTAARVAVGLCREGAVGALMKGALHTDELLGAVVSKDSPVRTARRISHAFVMDVPSLDRPLIITDAVVNSAPGILEKRDIAQNAIDFALVLGIEVPRVAILSAVETVNPAIPGTVDAAALCKMADRGQITGAILDGPLAFDNAVSEISARKKNITSPVAGSPDILLVPNLEAGNMLYKQLVYFGGAECAGLVLGTRVPVILTSRSDSVLSRVASCALAVLVAGSSERG
jgi:phosphate acetyltransferase